MSTVDTLIAVVSEKKDFTVWNKKFPRDIALRTIAQLHHGIAPAGFENLAIGFELLAIYLDLPRRDPNNRFALQVKKAIFQLDAITRQSNDTLDVVDVESTRKPENRVVAALETTLLTRFAEPSVYWQQHRLLRAFGSSWSVLYEVALIRDHGLRR